MGGSSKSRYYQKEKGRMFLSIILGDILDIPKKVSPKTISIIRQSTTIVHFGIDTQRSILEIAARIVFGVYLSKFMNNLMKKAKTYPIFLSKTAIPMQQQC